MSRIEHISLAEINELKRLSVIPLPNSPSDAGIKAQRLKNTFVNPIIDEDNGIVALLNNIIDGINANDGNSFVDLTQWGAITDLSLTPSANGYIDLVDHLQVANTPIAENGRYIQFVNGADRLAEYQTADRIFISKNSVDWVELANNNAVNDIVNNIINNIVNIANAQGGVALGTDSIVMSGGAVGKNSNAANGGAVGENSFATSGGAVGSGATVSNGGAVGRGAYAIDGFAGGSGAIASGTDNVQLGSGENLEDKTLAFRNRKLVGASGEVYSRGKEVGAKIDLEDLKNNEVQIQSNDGTDNLYMGGAVRSAASASISIGGGAKNSDGSLEGIAIGKSAVAKSNIELGRGTNNFGVHTFAVRGNLLMDGEGRTYSRGMECATLVDGKVPTSQLPSYVDDVIEGTLTDNVFTDTDGVVVVPETDKIYIDVDTNKQYRWGGTLFVEIGGSSDGLVIDLGSIVDGEFSIDADKVEAMFDAFPIPIGFTWSNFKGNMYRVDMSGDMVYYASHLKLEGTDYIYRISVDRTTKKGTFNRTEDKNIVDAGKHSLNNGTTWDVNRDEANKTNVILLKVEDSKTNSLRFFVKDSIVTDRSTYDFHQMRDNTLCKVHVDASTFTATYSEQVLADKDTASAMANRLKFNQLFDTTTSTLPTANGLTITNIYGGHHVAGTTDHQYYHKMYDIDTISGHWYYFAPNFSNTKSVYILGHIDGTAFSTNKGKVFEGGSKFDAYIQIEKEKTMDFDVQPILVDLTEMFGSGNEPQTEQEAYKYFTPNTYYPYNNPSALVDIDAFKYNFEQLINVNDIMNNSIDSGLTITSNNDGSYHITGTIADTLSGNTILLHYKTLIPNHSYYIGMNVQNTKKELLFGAYLNNSFRIIGTKYVYKNTVTELTTIYYSNMSSGTIIDSTISPILIDLTDMFGAGNEPSTVEELYQYIVPNKYYPYGRNIEPRMYCTKADANKMSMALSNTYVLGLLDKSKLISGKNEIKIPYNGNLYINFSHSSQTNIYITRNNETKEVFIPHTIYYNPNEFVTNIPVSKGDTVQINIGDKNVITKFIVNLCVAKELKI